MNKPLQAMSIFRWMWRAYSRAALIPLVLVEALLVAAYLVTNGIIADANIAALREQSHQRLARLLIDQGTVISEKINTVMSHAEIFRQASAVALASPVPDAAERARYAYTPSGAYYTTTDNGGAALYYSGIAPIGAAEQEKAWRSAALDPLMRQIRSASPLVMQLYFNSHDSMNRIYPYFDVLSQYPAQMDIPSYNFYYDADAAHNPGRRVVWTDVYLDPAGQGWMASCIAPVYRGDFLEGVVGLDVTVEVFIKQVINLDIPWGGYALLIDRSGSVMAMPPRAEADLGVPELTSHTYREAIATQELKPETFNLLKNPALRALGERVMDGRASSGVAHIDLRGPKLAAWSHVPATGWTLLALIPEDNIYADSNALEERFYDLGLRMIVALVVFYLMFFAFLYRRAQHMARMLSEPMHELARMAEAIGRGSYLQRMTPSPVVEVNAAATQLVAMGNTLGAVNQSLREAKDLAERASNAKSTFLAHMSHELRTPLNAILGFAQLLEMDRDKLPPDHQEYIDQISTSGQHLLSLINNVLELSRIESGRVEVAIEAVPIAAVISESLRLVEGMAAERGVVVAATDVPDCMVSADRLKLKQVLINLLSNGIKYNRAGGSVRLQCVVDHARGGLRVRIEDDGRGISAEESARLFQSFQRLRANDTVEGSGIGLVLSRHFMVAMGGTLELESSSAAGSCFAFEVPLAAD